MELHALAQREVVHAPVGRHLPRLGQARRDRIARHRLGERVVDGVHDHERRDDALGLGRIAFGLEE